MMNKTSKKQSNKRNGLRTMVFLVVIVAGSWCYNAWRSQPPQSLVDHQGMILDDEQQRRLIEIVFDAARQDDSETIDAYLGQGFTPNVRSPRGDTLLTVAAYHNSSQVVKSLLAHKRIDLQARNRMGLTAVAAAAFKGHTEILQLLLNAGAEADGANQQNQSALMFAALAGRKEAVKLLLAAGADRTRQDRAGRTAEQLARQQQADDVASLLRNH